MKSAIAVLSCDLKSCFTTSEGSLSGILNDRIVHPKMKGDIIYSNSSSKHMFFFLWLHKKIVAWQMYVLLFHRIKKGFETEAAKLQKNDRKTLWNYQKVVHMNCVLYSNSFEGPKRNVVICFAWISPALSFTFSDLDTLCWGTFLVISSLNFIVVYPYSFIQRVMDNLYGPLLWCVHLLYFWSLTIPVLFYCMEIISGVLVHTTSCNRKDKK